VEFALCFCGKCSQPCFLAAGVRLSTFDAAKKMLKKSQASYDDEMSKVAA